MPKPAWMSDETWKMAATLYREPIYTVMAAETAEPGITASDLEIQLRAIKRLIGGVRGVTVTPLAPAFDKNGESVAWKVGGTIYVSPTHASLLGSTAQQTLVREQQQAEDES